MAFLFSKPGGGSSGVVGGSGYSAMSPGAGGFGVGGGDSNSSRKTTSSLGSGDLGVFGGGGGGGGSDFLGGSKMWETGLCDCWIDMP
eukprot:2117453-Rhodomonas_salina.1